MKLKRAVKIVAGLFLLGILAFVSMLAVFSWRHPNSVTLPAPTGPFSVGRQSFDWIDAGRIDPLAPADGSPRRLTVWIWYPAASNSSRPEAEYLPAPWRQALVDEAVPLIRLLFGPFITDPASVHAHAIEEARMAASPSRFPVVLMKPGLGGLALQYAALAEDLASRGYVVVGSDSPYTTPLVVYGDGSVITRSPAGGGRPSTERPGRVSDLAPGQPDDLLVPVVEVGAADMSFLLDRLEGMNSGDSAGTFTGRLDLASIGAFGHSIGGAMALQFCHDDVRCGAGINIDGAVWGDVVQGGLATPFLFFTSDRPIFEKSEADLSGEERALLDVLGRIREGLPNSPSHVVLEGSRHFNFADSSLLTEVHLGRSVGMIGEIDPARGIAVTRRYVQTFFDTHLKGQSAGRLSSLSAEYPEARIE